MLAAARRDGDFDLWVGFGEGGKCGFYEGAERFSAIRLNGLLLLYDILHASGGAGPVAVVDVEAPALQDKGAHAVLRILLVL